MTSLEILDGGLLTTVQDLGRFGSQAIGVPVSGAMDLFALRAANRLVGNPDICAALEITLAGPEIVVLGDAIVAVTGGDLEPLAGGRTIGMWRGVRVADGTRLSFGGRRSGMRAYLAVAGGVDVPMVLGSRSTFTRAGLGGHEGRSLQSGDRLAIGAEAAVVPPGLRRLAAGCVPHYGHDTVVRVVTGPQDTAFTDEGLATFFSAAFALTPQSDRVGSRLSGPRVAHRTGADIVSDGTAFGAIQITGDGQPIVLMADRGTTGGYTKIATVISADLPLVAQLAPGDRVRFEAVSREMACAILRDQERVLDGLLAAPSGGSVAAEPVYDEDAGAGLIEDAYDELAAAIALDSGGTPGPGGQRPRRGGASAVAAVRAPMTGLVVQVLVAAEDQVEAGQTVAVVEAMKMQSPVRAGRPGRVSRVAVAPGIAVTAGDVLLEFAG